MGEYCCEKFKNEVEEIVGGVGTSSLKWDEKDNCWNVYGCCGHCFMLQGIIFCPFCGSSLIDKNLS